MNNRCVKCIRSITRSDVYVDHNGICNLCQTYKDNEGQIKPIDWGVFVNTLQTKYSPSLSRYQCMALFSGGKDSTYMLQLLSKIPDFRVLAVTIDHWFTSPETEENIRRVLKAIPVDHINFRPSWFIADELYKSLVTNTGELCLACEGFLTTEIYRLATEMRIPSMAWGLSHQQFRTPPNWITKVDINYWEKMHKRFIDSLGQAIGLESELYLKFQRNYVPIFDDTLGAFPDLLFPFLALGYDPDQVERSAQAIGWTRPTDVAGISSNCYANHLHNYLKRKLYTTDSLEDYLSHLVRKGTISRERALSALESPLDTTSANKILEEIGLEIQIDDLAKGLFQLRRCMC